MNRPAHPAGDPAPAHDDRAPRLTVVGAGARAAGGQGLLASITDGSAVIAVAGVVAGAFATETFKSFATGDASGRLWFIVLAFIALVVMGVGFWLRHRSRLGVRVGIIVNAVDASRGPFRAEQRSEQAERFTGSSAAVTLKAEVDLTGDTTRDRRLVHLLAEETLKATATAERLAPGAAHVTLIPTMPLHVAFHYGAQLGHTHAQQVAVHEIHQGDGTSAFFPATTLRAIDGKAAPLHVGRLVQIDGGDPTQVALALDLQGRGDQFFDLVKKACRERGIGWLLPLASHSTMLRQDMKTFDGVVSQVCKEWVDAPFPESARTGQHAIFLSGPVAIAVALGARLAAPTPGRWTAFTYNRDKNVYEPFPG